MTENEMAQQIYINMLNNKASWEEYIKKEGLKYTMAEYALMCAEEYFEAENKRKNKIKKTTALSYKILSVGVVNILSNQNITTVGELIDAGIDIIYTKDNARRLGLKGQRELMRFFNDIKGKNGESVKITRNTDLKSLNMLSFRALHLLEQVEITTVGQLLDAGEDVYDTLYKKYNMGSTCAKTIKDCINTLKEKV